MKRLLTLSILTLLFLITSNVLSQSAADFQLLDNFNSLSNGSINLQGNWTGNNSGNPDGALVSANPPPYFEGKAFHNNPDSVETRGNAYRTLGGASVAQGEQATLYFQLSFDNFSQSNLSLGLSDVADPPIFADDPSGPPDHFEVEINFSSSGLRVRDGADYRTVTNVTPVSGRLLHLWLVVDNQADSYQLYIEGPASGQVAAEAAGKTTFQFQNGTTDSLLTFVVENQGVTSGDAYLDNLYIDSSGSNLTAPTFKFERVDNFEGGSAGDLNGQNGWAAPNGGITIVTDPEDGSNRVVQARNTDAYARKSLSPIPNSGVGTLFFRIYRSGTVNAFNGLSDNNSASTWDAYEAQFGAQNDAAATFRVRDGGAFLSLGSDTFYNEAWTCVWLVVDNNNDQYGVYVEGGPYQTLTRLSGGGKELFALRNGGENPLNTVYLRVGPGSSGNFLVDDIYIDPTHENLTRPEGACPPSEPTVNPNQPISDPIPGSIVRGAPNVRFENIVTVPPSLTSGVGTTNPKTRINYMYHAKDGSGRLFVNDLRGQIHLIDPADNSISEYLDVADEYPLKTTGSLNAGLSSFAFHPGFEQNGLLYTIHYEFPNGTPDFDHPNNANQSARTHSVVVEWKTDNPAADIFSGTSREVMRLVQNTALHGVQLIEFNRLAPNSGDADYGTLYISIGDSEQEPNFSDVAQMMNYPQGKILRIIPDRNDSRGSLSDNQKYKIPDDNPYVGQNGILPEIWAHGFRNPIRFDWDPVTGYMLVSVVGQNNIEEIELVEPGKNYGWNRREGTFRFDPDNPDNVYPLPQPDDPDLVYPVAQYDHDEGVAIIGGFVYRGCLMPDLYGTYIFGDIKEGYLFYIDIDEIQLGQQTTIHRMTLVNGNGSPITFKGLVSSNSRADLRFGLDAEGEIYVMSKQDGIIRRLYQNRTCQGGPPTPTATSSAPTATPSPTATPNPAATVAPGTPTPLPNRPPTVNKPPNQTSTLGTEVSLPVEASDPDGDALTFTASNLPFGLTINPETGLITGRVDGPAAAGDGVEITVEDGRGGSDQTTFSWTVVDLPAPNVDPVIVNPGDQQSIAGELIDLGLAASDGDNDPLVFSATGLPDGLTIDATTGRIRGKLSRAGQYEVTVTAADRRGGNGSAEFGWGVAERPAEAPEITNAPLAPVGTLDEPLSIMIQATDPNGEPLTFAAQGLPAGLNIDSDSGQISGSPTAAGQFEVTVTVTNQSGLIDQVLFRLLIVDPAQFSTTLYLPLVGD